MSISSDLINIDQRPPKLHIIKLNGVTFCPTNFVILALIEAEMVGQPHIIQGAWSHAFPGMYLGDSKTYSQRRRRVQF